MTHSEPTAQRAGSEGKAQGICFTQSQCEAIAHALGHTTEGLTGPEIEHLLQVCRIKDVHPEATKWKRLHNAFAIDQNTRKNRRGILEFMRQAMKPERYLRAPERFEPLRGRLNRALLFAGLVMTEAGRLEEADPVSTIGEARQRAQVLRADLVNRGVHADVLKFCREELLADDYFHAVLEAVKSVLDKIRDRTGLLDDGNILINHALAGDPPMLAINGLRTPSEKSEQIGFANLVRGTVNMFRNPAAHEARIHWPMTKEDAEDLLSLVSLIHRRLDAAHMPPRF